MEWEELLTSQHDIWGNFFFFQPKCDELWGSPRNEKVSADTVTPISSPLPPIGGTSGRQSESGSHPG